MVMRRVISWTEVFLWVSVILIASAGPLHAAAANDGDILGLRGAEVTRIEIDRDGGDRVVMAKSSGVWNVLEPVSDVADQSAVTDLLSRLANLTVADVLRGDDSLFGFTPPQAKVRLTTAGGQIRELWVGDLRSPVSLFVKEAGSDTVYAISNVTLARIGQYPMGFVDSTLFRLDSTDEVEKITVRQVPLGGGEPREFTVVRSGIAWTYDSGAVAFDVDGFFRSVRLVQATGRLLDEQSAMVPFYPAPGSTQMVLTKSNGETVILDIGRKSLDGHHYYMKVSGRDDVYLVPSFHAEHVVRQAFAINDSLVAFNPADVKELKITIGPLPVQVDAATAAQNAINAALLGLQLNQNQDLGKLYTKNRDGVWEHNRAVVFGFNALLDAVANVGAERFAPAKSEAEYGFGVAPDSVTVEMKFNDNNTLLLQLGVPADDSGRVYVRTNMRPNVYIAFSGNREALIEAAETVRTKLFPAELANVAAVRVQKGTSVDYTVSRQGDRWMLGDTEVAESKVSALISAMVELSADSLPPIPEDETKLGFYPQNGSTRITIVFNDGEERYLDLGAGVQVGSGWFATTSYYAAVSDIEGTVAFIKEQAMRKIVQAADALR